MGFTVPIKQDLRMMWNVISMDPSLNSLKIPNDGLIQKDIVL